MSEHRSEAEERSSRQARTRIEEPATVGELLCLRAGDDPDATAMLVDGGVVDGGGSLTYGSWDRRSDAVARGLVARGVGRGDRVLLLFDNARWVDYAVAYVAVLRAGAVAVPVGTRFAGPELAGVARHCGAVAVVCPDDLAPDLRPPGPERPSERGDGPERPSERGDRPWVASVAELVEAEDRRGGPFQVPVDGDDLAEILYSSGTTGAPKGVAVSHAGLMFHDPPPGDEAPGRATLVHAFPVGTNAAQEVLRLPLRRGDRTLVVMPVFDAERFCALVAEHRVRRIQLVPSMALVVVGSGAPGRHDLSSVERVVLSSAPTPPALLPRVAEAFPNAVVWNTYALTEGGTARTLLVDAVARPASVGRGVGGTEVRAVDDGGGDRPPGEVGEVWLRRPGAPLRRYYLDPEATAATWAGDWLRTGDLGYLDPEGYLYLVDRKKDVIVTGGLNVASLEVEGVLHEHPAVVEAAVFGVPHDVLGQDVAAAVVLRSPVATRELTAFARERLAEYKTPHHVFVVDDLPRTVTGKVLKRELRDRFAVGGAHGEAAGTAPVVAARTPTEAAVVAVWEEVLGRRPIGVADDFFDHGGHSLAAAQIVARVNDVFSIDLPVTAVFDASTAAEVAALVDRAKAVEGAG